jgi:hypothetical protein
MAIRIGRWLRRVLLAALTLEALYAVPAHIYLHTPFAGRLLNRRPDKFHIDWSLALTPWPGLVHLRGVRMEGRSRAILWEARLASVTGWFGIRPLIDRVVHLRSVRGTGIEYAQRPRLDPGGTAPPGAVDWPEIAGRADRPDPQPMDGPDATPAASASEPWTIRADRIVCDIRQIWIHRYRIAGAARLETAMSLQVRGPLEFPRIDYRLERGDIWVGQERMFADLRLAADVRIAPFVARRRTTVDFLRSLSGEFDLDAQDGSLRFLEAYLEKAPGLRFNGGGSMRLHLALEAGRLLPGSCFERLDHRIDTVFLDSRFTGTGRITGEVTVVDGVPTSRIEALTGAFEITQAGRGEPYARGEGLQIVATSTSLDLADPFADLRLTIDQPGSEIRDLSFYNIFLPAGSKASIVSGIGRLAYHFETDADDRSLRGEMTLDMKDLALRFEDTILTGDVRIAARLRHGDPVERRFDIAGTEVALHHRDPSWNGSIRFPEATLTFAEPIRLQARAAVDLQDTRPIVVLFDARKDIAPWIERLMTIADVRGTTGLRVEGEDVEVRELQIDGKGLKALGDLTLTKGGRDGILYLRFRGFSIGIELVKSTRNLKIMRPLAWFEQERAKRRGGGTGP